MEGNKAVLGNDLRPRIVSQTRKLGLLPASPGKYKFRFCLISPSLVYAEGTPFADTLPMESGLCDQQGRKQPRR